VCARTPAQKYEVDSNPLHMLIHHQADPSLLSVFCLRVNGIGVKRICVKFSISLLFTFIKQVIV